MSKAKLTLYVDEDVARIAHKRAKLTGKSISGMVKEYFMQKEREARAEDISPSVSKWTGILKTKKSYKKLRDEHIDQKLKKYESAG